jgi:hypothetical protein
VTRNCPSFTRLIHFLVISAVFSEAYGNSQQIL